MKKFVILIVCCLFLFTACKQEEEPVFQIDIPAVENTPHETEQIVEPTIPAEAPTQPNSQPVLKEDRQTVLQDVFTQDLYTIDNTAVRTTLHNFATLSMIHDADGEILYSVAATLPEEGYLEAALYQNPEGKIYFYDKENTPWDNRESWYICENTEDYQMEENKMNVAGLHEAIDKMTSMEYIETIDNQDHVIMYSGIAMDHLEESDAQMVYDIFIEQDTYAIRAVRYYIDDVEWYVEFLTPEQASFHMETPNTTSGIDIMDANNKVGLSLSRAMILYAELTQQE